MTHLCSIKLNDLSAQWAEIRYDCIPDVIRYMEEGQYVGSRFIKQFEIEWAEYVGSRYAYMVSNGTDAYKLALQALDVYPNDTCILLQDNTWASILFITKELGFKYEIIDCDEYLQFDIEMAEDWLQKNRHKYRDVVLVPTDILGHPCNPAELLRLKREYDVFYIEDCSQAHGARTHYGTAGRHADIAFYSLYPGKNLGSIGEAGIINTSNCIYATRLKALRNCGMLEKNVFHLESGNYRPDGLGAVILSHKLKKLNEWTVKRNEIATLYKNNFEKIPKTAAYVHTHAYHYFPIYFDDRDRIIHKLDENKIPYSINYPFTLSSLECLQPNYYADTARKSMLCLPCHQYLTSEDVNFISEIVLST